MGGGICRFVRLGKRFLGVERRAIGPAWLSVVGVVLPRPVRNHGDCLLAFLPRKTDASTRPVRIQRTFLGAEQTLFQFINIVERNGTGFQQPVDQIRGLPAGEVPLLDRVWSKNECLRADCRFYNCLQIQ